MPPIIKAFDGFIPEIGSEVFVADGAVIVGNVSIGARSSVWYGAVIRGDLGRVHIGEGAAVQDLACLHQRSDAVALVVGDDVSVGHGAIVHGAQIGNGVLIGIGALILDGAEIGEQSIIAPGSLVTRDSKFPPRTLIRGRPAAVVRDLSEAECGLGAQEAAQLFSLAQKASRLGSGL